MSDQKRKLRPEIINIKSNESSFYPYSVKKSKYKGSCNNISDLYAKLCVPDVVKNMNVKAFNLISKSNKARYIIWHETCRSNCRLNPSACHNKDRWNEYKCRCECKELIEKGIWDQIFNLNSSNWECECDKS